MNLLPFLKQTEISGYSCVKYKFKGKIFRINSGRGNILKTTFSFYLKIKRRNIFIISDGNCNDRGIILIFILFRTLKGIWFLAKVPI